VSTVSSEFPHLARCARCGHEADHHRLDDAQNVSPLDPAALFRCLGGAQLRGCPDACPDYVADPRANRNRHGLWTTTRPASGTPPCRMVPA
jgi:hypothetical protein